PVVSLRSTIGLDAARFVMTPEAWFAEVDPKKFFEAIKNHPTWFGQQSTLSPRRFRLFACATARQVWDLLSTDACSAVQASERYAEGRTTQADLLATAVKRPNTLVTASQIAQAVAQAANSQRGDSSSELRHQLLFDPTDAARNAARAVATRDVGPAPPGRPTTPEWHTAWTAAFASARAIQADYFRDIFPPPRYIPQRDPHWITSTVVALARQMDESGDFSTVPILADALQDAGCEDETLLSCCRTPSKTHVRGNWVVDLVLERT
ncbi:MAG TPA: hypothetical protein VG122_07720, partial [Gemmata sp.]|nr:hypothetical protein [Gemmata sp.]